MQIINPQFITDKNGNKISVVLTIKDFNAIMEELEDINQYDSVKESLSPSYPIDEAFKKIEKNRKKK